MSAVFTPEEEARINERARRIAVVREAHQRARRMRPLLVGSDRLQKLDDLVKAIHDDPAVTRRVRRITGRVADLIDELLELLAVHNTSPSGSGSTALTVDASTGTVGEPSTGTGGTK